MVFNVDHVKRLINPLIIGVLKPLNSLDKIKVLDFLVRWSRFKKGMCGLQTLQTYNHTIIP